MTMAKKVYAEGVWNEGKSFELKHDVIAINKQQTIPENSDFPTKKPINTHI